MLYGMTGDRYPAGDRSYDLQPIVTPGQSVSHVLYGTTGTLQVIVCVVWDDRYPAGDRSYDSQPIMMVPGHSAEQLIHRDDAYNRPAADPMSMHMHDPADRPYGADRPYNVDQSYGADRSYGADQPYGSDPMSIHIRGAGDRMYDRGYGDNAPRNYVSFVFRSCVL